MVSKNEATKKDTGLTAIKGGALSTTNYDTNDFFDESVVVDRAADTLIPVLRLVHPTSKIVQEGKASPGTIIDSVTNEALADKEKGVEFIPVKEADKMFSVDRHNGKKWEFLRMDAYDPKLAGFESREWSEPDPDTKKPVQYRRNQRLSFYVMLARDATTGKFPYMISFQRTSYKAGQAIASFFNEQYGNYKNALATGAKDKLMNFIPQVGVFTLKSKHLTGPEGPYFVLEVTRDKRSATKEEMERAIFWTKQLKLAKGSIKVHDVDTQEQDVDTTGSTEERY